MSPHNDSLPVNSPLVSVVVPVYNGERFVGECLDSLSAQTYRPLEIIIADDGSTDRSAEIAEQHTALPIVLREPHRCAPAVRNAGIRRATGEYVAFCDVDDLWTTDKIQKQVAIFEAQQEVGFVFTDYARVDAKGENLRYRKVGRLEKAFNKSDQFASLVLRNSVPTSTVMLRRSLFERIGFFDETMRIADDWDLWIRVAKSGTRMHRINEVLMHYRLHGQNISSKIETIHRDRLQVLTKAFDGLDDTPAVRRLKNRALALAYFEAANSLFSVGDRAQFRTFYREARRFGGPLLSPKAFRRRVKDMFHG